MRAKLKLAAAGSILLCFVGAAAYFSLAGQPGPGVTPQGVPGPNPAAGGTVVGNAGSTPNISAPTANPRVSTMTVGGGSVTAPALAVGGAGAKTGLYTAGTDNLALVSGPCQPPATGGVCIDPAGANETRLQLGGRAQLVLRPGQLGLYTMNSFAGLQIGRLDVPQPSFAVPIGEVNFVGPDASGAMQNWCGITGGAENSGVTAGPGSDLGALVIACLKGGVLKPVLSVSGSALSFPSGLALARPWAVPQFGDGEIGGAAPIELPATNLLQQANNPCVAPWTWTNVTNTGCANPATVAPTGLAEFWTMVQTANGGSFRQNPGVPNNTTDYYAFSVYVDLRSAGGFLRIKVFSPTYAADYFLTGTPAVPAGSFNKITASQPVILAADPDPTARAVRLTIIGQNSGVGSAIAEVYPGSRGVAGETASSANICCAQLELLPVIATATVVGTGLAGQTSLSVDYAPAGLFGLIVQAAGVPVATTVTAIGAGGLLTLSAPLTANVSGTINFVRPRASRYLPTVGAAVARQLGAVAPSVRYGPQPTVAAGAADCGTSPAIAGNNGAFRVTVGGSTNGGKCTVTFAPPVIGNAWSNPPACIAQNESSAQLLRATATATTVTLNGTLTAADKLVATCEGY